jgi:nitrogenase molybdenum-iron protein beta chain
MKISSKDGLSWLSTDPGQLLGKGTGRGTDAHFVNVSWPVNERLVINGYYAGYDGGLRLLEDIYSVVRTRFN